MDTLHRLKAAIESAWEVDTSADPPHWSLQNRAWGQDLATAMVIQEYLAGDILRAEANPGGAHYWNRLPDGTEIDLTMRQFNVSGVALGKIEFRERNHLLLNAIIKKRYEKLLQRVEVELNLQLFNLPSV